MDDDVAQIDQYPIAAVFAFDAERRMACGFAVVVDFAGERVQVAVGGAAGDDHVVGDVGFAGEINGFDVDGFEFGEAVLDQGFEFVGVHGVPCSEVGQRVVGRQVGNEQVEDAEVGDDACPEEAAKAFLVEFVPQERTGDERARPAAEKAGKVQGGVGDALPALFGGAFVVTVEDDGQHAHDGAGDAERQRDEGQAEEVEDIQHGIDVAFDTLGFIFVGDVVGVAFHDGVLVLAQEDAACLPTAFLGRGGEEGDGDIRRWATVVVGEVADVEEEVFVAGLDLDEAVAFFVVPVNDAALVGAAFFEFQREAAVFTGW